MHLLIKMKPGADAIWYSTRNSLQFYGESMKKVFSKIFVGIGIAIVSIPVLLLALFVVIEVVGSIANHAATVEQFIFQFYGRTVLLTICIFLA